MTLYRKNSALDIKLGILTALYLGVFSFSLLVFTPLQADEKAIDLDFPYLKNFEVMEKYNGKKIKIRGFLYRSTNKEWILAGEPDLKSCCIGAKTKNDQQICLEGSFDSKYENYASDLVGDLRVEKKAKDGFIYFLQQPVLLTPDKKDRTIVVGFILLIMLAGGAIMLLQNRRWFS